MFAMCMLVVAAMKLADAIHDKDGKCTSLFALMRADLFAAPCYLTQGHILARSRAGAVLLMFASPVFT